MLNNRLFSATAPSRLFGYLQYLYTFLHRKFISSKFLLTFIVIQSHLHFFVAAANVSNNEPTLSDLKEDYILMRQLDDKLDLSAFGNVKDLSLSFPLSFKERSNILNSVLACRDFFRHLSKWKPDVKLLDLQFDVETFSLLPNRKNGRIFKKINEDIRDGLVSLSLSSTLGKLAKNPISMLYIEENIADNLAPEEGNLLPNWKDIGSCHGYKNSELEAICKKHQSKESKTERLFSLLCNMEPPPSLSRFIQHCRAIKRNDIARVLEGWYDRTMVSTSM